MRASVFVLCFCILITLTTIVDVTGEPIVLRYKLEPGEVQTHQIEMEVKMDIETPQCPEGDKVTLKMKLDVGMATKCISADENEYMCMMRFYSPCAEADMVIMGKRMRVVMDSSGMEMYDGKNLVQTVHWSDFSDPSVPNLGDLTKVKIRCRIGSNGELLEILDKEELKAKFSGFGLDQMVGAGLTLPEGPIDVGESWDGTIETDLDAGVGCGIDAARMRNDVRYTLEKLGKYKGAQCAVINVKGTGKTMEEDSTFTLDQDFKGTSIVEIATGKVLYAKLDGVQELDGEFSGVEMKADGTAGMTVRYSGNQVPKDAIEEDMLGWIDPELLKALNEIRVPIMLDDRTKIGKDFYQVKDIVMVNGTELRLLKFTDDRIYLKDEKSRIIYKIVVNFRGEVTSIKPLMGKDG